MNNFIDQLSAHGGCAMIGKDREQPLRQLAPGQRFELVLTATTPYPHRRIPGTVVRHGPGTTAVVVDHAEKERSFTTHEGQLITLHTTGGIQYWAPSTPVIKLNEPIRDVSRWTTKGGTGVGLSPEAEAEDEIQERSERDKRQEESDMAPEKVAQLPGVPAKAKTKPTANGQAKAPRQPKPLNSCLCGCGEQVTGRFRQGHDGRYYSILRKVVAAEMAFNEMPKQMQQAAQNMNGVKKLLAQHGAHG